MRQFDQDDSPNALYSCRIDAMDIHE